MADATATLVTPNGFTVSPQSIGVKKLVVRDVKWVSDNANLTAGKTVNASDVGLQHLDGAIFLGDYGALYSSTDAVGQLKVVATDNDTVVLTGLSSAGAALDLDSTDIAVARVGFIGD
jgi:hypothetical protein